MRVRRLLSQYDGPPTAELVGAGINATISGSVVTAASAAQTAGSRQNLPLENRLVMFVCAMSAAGVGTTVDRAYINGIPAFVEAQANTGGSLVAIISAPVNIMIDDRIFRLRAELSVSGVTAARTDCFVVTSLSGLRPLSKDLSTTAIDTARTVTIPIYTRGYVALAAINDVGAANQCTWTGSAQNPSEISDVAVGAYRGSTATRLITVADNLTATFTATFDVISTTGISLVGAFWR